MKVVTAQEMREIDQRAIADFQIPGIVLMENAGFGVSQAVTEKLNGVQGKTVTIFAGKGNNGGDGLVAARHLFNMGVDVKVLLLDSPDKVMGEAAVNLEIWRKLGQKVYTITQKDDLNAVRLFLVKTDIIVDAIYGTGFGGEVKDYIGRIIEAVNASEKPVISVDIPSGVESDSGRVKGPAIRANMTVTFGLPKAGLLLEPGASYTGDLRVVDISLPGSLLSDEHIRCNLIEDNLVKGWIPFRQATSHKGDYGKLLVIAGSRGMAGAACLAAEAAARIGAGLVSLVVPHDIYEPVASKLTEVMVIPVSQTAEGTISKDALPVIKAMLEKSDVLALGPGLSTNQETAETIRRIVSFSTIPVVLDADGLNAFVDHTDAFEQTKSPLVLTPHPGEMARLAGIPVDTVQGDRLQVSRSWSSNWGAVLVLKGARSIVATPEGNTYICATGNPGMATGGSGDVLTGIIAGLLAQGMDAAVAAAAGVHLHGKAGDMAAGEKGMMGLIAGDILQSLPVATRMIEGYES